MKKFVNLTPHNVTLNGDTIPSTGIARCEEITLGTTQVGGIQVDSRIYGKTVGLPDQQEDVCLIVSHIVAQNNPNRPDLFWPGSLKRDAAGNVIGVESLNQLPRHNEPAYFKYAYDLKSKFGNGMFIGVVYDKDHNQTLIPTVEPFVMEDGTMLYSNEGGHWLKPTQEEAKAYQDLIAFAVDQSMNNEYPSLMKELPVIQNKLILP